MKLLHLLQDGLKVPLGYRFTLYNYGPDDTEVMSDIEFAESLGQVSVEYQGPDKGYRIQSVATATVPNSINAIKPKLTELMNYFGSMTARELELRSTLLFLSRDFKDDSLANRLRELKPKYSDHEARAAMADLRQKNFLQ